MMTLLPPWPLFSVFLLASVVLAITPGPGVLYIIASSIAQGRTSGLASVAGVAFGNLGNALAASIGLAALFAVSSAAFYSVKYAGAFYLVYLGVQMLRESQYEISTPTPQATGLDVVFRDGFIVAMLNPKTTIFFAAFLPQFLSPEAQPMSQIMMLSLLFVVIAAVTDSIYALTASLLAPALEHVRHGHSVGRYIGGCMFIGLGIYTAFTGSRNAK